MKSVSRKSTAAMSLKNKKIRARFEKLNCCIVVPTYNNCLTLGAVLDNLLEYTDRIVVVNDGSTDATEKVLKKYSKKCSVITLPKNRGKGNALRTAFRFAFAKNYRYAITIDSDGQHLPEDLPQFLDMIEKNPGSIVIGARNMAQNSVPKKSSFGNKFSNFWFKVESGIELPDTQSGYRLYPLAHVGSKKYFTRKYEFEIEVLVRASWAGIRIHSVPVKVIYQEGDERVTHFRPFKDFSRISVLNTFLVTWALMFIKPRDFLKSLTVSNVKRIIKKNVFLREESTLKIVLSIAFGIFMGIAPVWGYQLIIAIALASIFKLNKFLVIAAANVSIPPFIPIIIFLSFKTGGWVLHNAAIDVQYSSGISLSFIKTNLLQYVVGSILFGFAAACAGALISFVLVSVTRRKSTAKIVNLDNSPA